SNAAFAFGTGSGPRSNGFARIPRTSTSTRRWTDGAKPSRPHGGGNPQRARAGAADPPASHSRGRARNRRKTERAPSWGALRHLPSRFRKSGRLALRRCDPPPAPVSAWASTDLFGVVAAQTAAARAPEPP